MQLAFNDNGPGPVVVLLHGFPLDRTMWASQVEAISCRYRVVTPDLRGLGTSCAPEGIYPMEDMANDVLELLDTLRINEPVILGGLSMGGYVALAFAVRNPKRLRALILMDTRAGADTPEGAKVREENAKKIEADGNVDRLVESMSPKLFGKSTRERDPGLIARVEDRMRRSNPRGAAGALSGMAARPDRSADLSRLTLPTLVLVGREDELTPPSESERMAQALPNSRYVEIPNAGHLAPLENPQAVNEALLSFLDSLA